MSSSTAVALLIITAAVIAVADKGTWRAPALRCPICAGLGRPADHRVGSARCTPPKKRPNKRGGKTAKSQPTRPAEIEAMDTSDTRKRGAGEDEGDPSVAPKEKRPPRAEKKASSPPAPLPEGDGGVG